MKISASEPEPVPTICPKPESELEPMDISQEPGYFLRAEAEPEPLASRPGSGAGVLQKFRGSVSVNVSTYIEHFMQRLQHI